VALELTTPLPDSAVAPHLPAARRMASGFALRSGWDAEEAEGYALLGLCRALRRRGGGPLENALAIVVMHSAMIDGWRHECRTSLQRHTGPVRSLDEERGSTVTESLIAPRCLPSDDVLDLRRAVRQLRPRQRLLLWLLYVQDLSQTSVARRWNVTPSNISTSHSRVLASLRHHLAMPP
jgi:RNA polymerase sigma factor (sigma-70 family)